MRFVDVLQLLVFFLVLMTTTPWLGSYMAKLFQGEATFLQRPLGWLERAIYRCGGVNENEEMSWANYASALIWFNLFGLVAVFLIQILQGNLPLNPQGASSPTWHSAINTAVSYVTNTNWQAYAGETTMSDLTQMAALTVQNFVSAATGIAVAIAVARGIARRSSVTIGNFWADMVRSVVYLLLPLSILMTLFLVGQGVVQTLGGNIDATSLEGSKQTIALGPVASQVAIKQLGTNGGGFFNANSAHPFENPTPLSNFVEMLAIFLIPSALTYAFGAMVGNKRHGWILFGTMAALFLGLLAIALHSELGPNPVLATTAPMEGKEVRFGVFSSVFFSMVTTAASCGAVNAMHGSLSPLSGGVAMLNMMLGEVVFGGVGAGLYGILLFVLLTVFLAGLMVGRTPEYLGKKVEAREMTLVIAAVLAPSVAILMGTGLSVVLRAGLSGLGSGGPHGFSEILYAFTSAAANNGSAFAGLNANTPYYNLVLALVMLIGRFAIIVPVLGIAGSFAAKTSAPRSPGTFEVDTPLFAALLMGVILIVGGLTFVPALSLGPIVEQLLMLRNQTF